MSADQVAAVRRIVIESVAKVDALAPGLMQDVLPALAAARAELQNELAAWLRKAGAAGDKFTPFQKRQLLLGLESTFERIRELEPAMASALDAIPAATGPLAVANLTNEVARLSAVFGDGVPVLPDISTAAIVARGERMRWARYPASAARYAGSVGDDIRQLLAVGLAKGETIPQMATRLRRLANPAALARGVHPEADAASIADGIFRRSQYAAERLVHTELMTAYNVQHEASIVEANDNRSPGEDEYLRRWDAAADRRVCSICAALDGKTTTIGGTFPGGYDAPPAHPWCFLPGTRVGARVVAAMRSNYSGGAVEIETASGRRLRVTVNHPIAAERGFVAAATLRAGDRVLSQRGNVWNRLSRVDEQHEPPMIDEVFRALGMKTPPTRTPLANDDLHGDAARCDGDVDVVAVDRELHYGAMATLVDGVSDLAFPLTNVRHVAHARLRRPHLALERSRRTSNGIVSLRDLASTLVGGHSGPLDRLLFGLPAQGNARRLEPAIDDVSRDPMFVGKLIHGLASDVFLDEITQVRAFDYSGHVYDLQTETGWLVSEGIYSSNCRCVTLAWQPRWGTAWPSDVTPT